MPLKGKVALITGAGRGIGRAIALNFAESGAMVALVARSKREIERVQEEIAQGGGTAIAIPTDIAVEEQVVNMTSTVESRLGPIDVLVNNAGVMILRSIVETSVEDWHRVMNVNLLGAFMCARAVMPSMMQRKTGRIINIGSLAGRRGYVEQGVYSASKHGLYGLTKVLALEGQPYGIRVGMVSPGGVLTDLSANLLATRHPAEAMEWMTPEEVASAVHFMATQDGPATTDDLVLRRFTSDPWR